MLANGNILFEDVPGLAKTLMARTFASLLSGDFRRIQFTPDLLPSDITGISIYKLATQEFEFRPGPVFCNLLLSDEINRASPKTQSALLEAMQEKTVSIDGVTHPLPDPFIVVATQNPIELEGTFPLPEAQLDRFMIRLRVGYPSASAEGEILKRRRERRMNEFTVQPIMGIEEFKALQLALEDVSLDPTLDNYIVEIVQATRADKRVQLGSSPRGSLAIMAIARGSAFLQGRSFVNPEDVKRATRLTLPHRLILRTSAKLTGLTDESLVDEILSAIPTPAIEVKKRALEETVEKTTE
ncbi:MAG: AAA family ATPase [Candidatus Heimdallarchaeota archaeon]|nr:AAA family ATPase [Candidatus Heimdallarchaeota archaeon]MCK5047848.1 AAA family ATPase [Candidatus Heimdallarchaeota archaeon]